MSDLPSLWSLLVSTLMFFLSVWYIRRYLDEQDIPRGMTRGMLVFTLACVVSWVSGALMDRMQQPATRAFVAEQPARH